MTPASSAPRIPQPRPRPIVGNAPDIDSEAPIQSMVELARQLGPIYRLSFRKGLGAGDQFAGAGRRRVR